MTRLWELRCHARMMMSQMLCVLMPLGQSQRMAPLARSWEVSCCSWLRQSAAALVTACRVIGRGSSRHGALIFRKSSGGARHSRRAEPVRLVSVERCSGWGLSSRGFSAVVYWYTRG
eukprot:2242096-Prymnesium_polylepis.1